MGNWTHAKTDCEINGHEILKKSNHPSIWPPTKQKDFQLSKFFWNIFTKRKSLTGIEPDYQHYQRSLVPLDQTSVLEKNEKFQNINFVRRFFLFPAVCTKDLRKKGDELDGEKQSRMDSGILHINTHIRNPYIQNQYTSASELKSKGRSYEHITDLEMFLSFTKCYFQVGWMRRNTSDNQWKSCDNPIDELTFAWSMTW